MRIAYVDASPGGQEVHVADYTQSGVIRSGDVIELGGVVWEIQNSRSCPPGVTSAIDGGPVDAVVRVLRAVTP